MKKAISLWGLISMLFICLIAAYPKPIEETPLSWEPITIVETTRIKPSEPPSEHKYIRHYDPIKPDYECREFTQEEAQMLMRIATAEAGNQGIYGMALIMQVVLNRVSDPAFPNSIQEVIEQPGQFETVKNETYYSVKLTIESHLALAEIERGIPYDTSIIGFETASNGRALERYFAYAYTSGDHDFYIIK